MKKEAIIEVSMVACCIIVLFILPFIFQIMFGKIVSKQNQLQRHIMLGAWTEGFFDPTTQTLHPEKIQAFEKLIQRNISIAHYYIGWEALESPNLLRQFDTLENFGWTSMLNVNPYYFSECPAIHMPLYKAIAEGKCDNFLVKAAQNIRKVKQSFYLAFAWEMNNSGNEWSVAYTGSAPSDFITAWRHMYTLFKNQGVSNVIWVFCPNVPDDSNFSYKSLYPGDKYVDWIGMDGYNWGTTQSWSKWISFSGVFSGSYKKLTAIAPNKPVMIAEVNTTDKGGDKGAWYVDTFAKQIPYHFPKIHAVIVFNEDRSKQENVNWKIDQTPQSLRGFITGVRTTFYK